MEQSIHRNPRGHNPHRGYGKHRSWFRIKWFNRFRRFDEYGFVNPKYDKINLVMGKVTAVLLLIAFIVLLILCFNETFPLQEVY